METVRSMKFSENFVHLMTTPVAKLALERGDESKDDITEDSNRRDLQARKGKESVLRSSERGTSRIQERGRRVRND